ncbi:hypothetical protein [Paenibacillus maysiensis]|nr:hypothetical protein [Paenibacillus maysiensis]
MLKNILEQVADVSMSHTDQTAGMAEDVSASRQAPKSRPLR